MAIFIVVGVFTKDYATAAAADDDDDVDAVFLIEIKIDQGVVEVGNSNGCRSSICYC